MREIKKVEGKEKEKGEERWKKMREIKRWRERRGKGGERGNRSRPVMSMKTYRTAENFHKF